MKKHIFIIMALLIILLSLASCKTEESLPPPEPVEKKPEPTYISIISCGDNLYHMPVVNSGKNEDGSYSYEEIYRELQPMISDADISVICQETIFAGEDRGYSGYPLFNSPSGVGDSIAKEGFDIVLHASNHVMDKGIAGIESTIEFWKTHPEITVLGIHETPEDDNRVEILDIKGANIALLDYTYGTNGIPVPADKSYMVEITDEEKIKADALYAEENADFTIAFMHWGTEYATYSDAFQKELAYNMADWGVDLIIGSHPHVIQPVEKITTEAGNELVVFYSLGNFVSRQLDAINLLGGIADVKLKFFEGEVILDKYFFIPIVTHYNTAYNSFTVYPLNEYTDEIASGHGVAAYDGAVSVERFRNMVDKVFEGYDKSVIKY